MCIGDGKDLEARASFFSFIFVHLSAPIGMAPCGYTTGYIMRAKVGERVVHIEYPSGSLYVERPIITPAREGEHRVVVDEFVLLLVLLQIEKEVSFEVWVGTERERERETERDRGTRYCS